ncbi:hypothetical protein [Simplicispira suum]|uniref:hypothetical protein n=1 Tax=Simplicispira suum TaxID=2109915 RepID=UPI0014764707|nr:hypothetical protein [Simplicispira suum]
MDLGEEWNGTSFLAAGENKEESQAGSPRFSVGRNSQGRYVIFLALHVGWTSLGRAMF